MSGTSLEGLRVFLAVAEAGSVTGAARALGMPKSSVSRAVQTLEQALGVKLFHRASRRVALSTAGIALRERVTLPLAALEGALETMPERRSAPDGVLRLSTTGDFAAMVLAPLVVRFTHRYPEVSVVLHTGEAPVDLVGGHFDAAVRFASRPLPDSAWVAKTISPLRAHLYASTTWIATQPPLRVPEELSARPWVLLREPRRLRLQGGGRTVEVRQRGRFTATDMFVVEAAVRAGGGIGVLPDFVGEPRVKTGELVRVLPGWSLADARAWLLTPAGPLPPKTRVFREAMLALGRSSAGF